MIKKGGETIRNVLLDLFNEVIRQDQQAPEQWKQNMLTIVFKKGDPKDPGNYRPISVIPILYKILARLLYARLAPQLIGQQCEDQAGFRPHYSTVDHLFVFTCLEEKSHEFNQTLWTAALDFKKAFDTVEHHHLWEALKQQGVQPGYVSLLQDLYKDQNGRVKTDVISKTFHIERGTKQGDPLSSLLFNALLEHIMRPLKSQWEQRSFGVKLNEEPNQTLTNLRFADDVLLVGRSLHQIEKMLTELKLAAESVGLELHPDKTKILSNTTKRTGRPNTRHITIGTDKIEILTRSQHIKYLGRLITFEEANSVEVNQRIRAAWAKFSELRHELTSKHYCLRDRLRLFESTVSATLLYACEALTLIRSTENLITRTQRRMLRMILGASRRRTIPTTPTLTANHQQTTAAATTNPATATIENKENSESDNDIQSNPDPEDTTQQEHDNDEDDNLEPWVDWIKRTTQHAEQQLGKLNINTWIHTIRTRKWRFLARVVQMPSNRWTKAALLWAPQSTSKTARRNEGHPRKRWTDDIDDYLKAQGIQETCVNTATNSTTWNKLERGYVQQQT